MTTPDLPTRFPRLADALAAGYRRCGPKWGDHDVSGQDSFGYAFQAMDGRTSVTVSLYEEPNKMGAPGSSTALMPPSAMMTEDQEIAAAQAEWERHQERLAALDAEADRAAAEAHWEARPERTNR